jgi:hypothetical protein
LPATLRRLSARGSRRRDCQPVQSGIYFGTGLISAWAGATVRRQDTLVFLIAASVFMAGLGRLLSISQVGLPQPAYVWLGYLIPELVLPWVAIAAQIVTNRRRAS